MSGAFISFEGIDGCGKTTQIGLLVERLAAQGIEPLLVREPGGTRLGEQVREMVLSTDAARVDPAAEALLYAASRAQLVAEVLRPALAEGRFVIADRFVHSSLAYQGAGRELGEERVAAANELALDGLRPDVTLLLQLTPQEAARRQQGAPDRIEAAGDVFFARVAEAYARLARSGDERVVPIDGAGSSQQVHERVLEALVRAEVLDAVVARR